MRTWVILISIFLILGMIVISETIIINNFCDEVEKSVTNISQSILSDDLSDEKLNSLFETWQKNKTFVFALSNHNSFYEFEKYINDLYYYKGTDNKERMYHSAVCLKNANEHFKSTLNYSFENIF